MRTLISLTFSLSLLSGFYTKLSHWASNQTSDAIMVSEQANHVQFMTNDTLSIMDASIVEGNDTMMIDTLKFVLEREQANTDFTVWFYTVRETAIGGFYTGRNGDTDFIAIGDSLRFTSAMGNLTDTIKVPILEDMKTELDETFQVRISAITNTTDNIHISDSVAIGTIINNDTSYLSIRDTMVIEGNGTSDSFCFVVDMVGELDTIFSFSYTTMDSTALASSDYLPQMGMATGSGTGVGYNFYGLDTIKIGVQQDLKTERNEFLKLLSNTINGYGRALLFQDSVAVGNIINDDTTHISITDASIVEGDTGTDSVEFIITLDKMVDSLGIAYLTLDSTATTADADYTMVNDTIYLNCKLTDTIKVAIPTDTKVELDEYFKLELRELLATDRPVFYSDSIGVGTITNDDTARITINDVILEEGDTGTTKYNFVVTLDQDLDRSITLDYATCDSTAMLADKDYNAAMGTLNFTGTANEMDTIMVMVLTNPYTELDEKFGVKLSNITHSGLAVFFEDSLGIGTILNDDFEPSIADPCDCLNNASNDSSKDGQFSETVEVHSQSGETWYISSIQGLYKAPIGAFPPAKGGNPYPLLNYLTGVLGYELRETVDGNGLSYYTINGLHVDGIGYEITVTNGTDTLSIGNLCHYETACSTDQTIVMPFFKNVKGKATIRDCSAENKFIDDGIHLYQDDMPRNNSTTICPNVEGQLLTVSFQKLDLAAGDTLWVYEGKDTTTALLAKGSGNSPSLINGGWVTSNCDPNINPSGCLTFVFTTNGDNSKGTGWEALVNCTLQGQTSLNRPNDVFATVGCDSLSTPVNLRTPTINQSNTDCSLINQDIIVTYCDVRDTIPAGTLTYPVFPFGSYEVTYKLLADTTITTSNRVYVTVVPMTCNDTVITAIGQGCVTSITPDDILEDGCDTLSGNTSRKYRIKILTDKGVVEGITPNYPILDASKDGNITCNKTYEVSIFRILETSKNGCAQRTIDSCSTQVKFIDGVKPVFVDVQEDTIYGCHDKLLTKDLLPKPRVIDNCEIVSLVADIPTNTNGICETSKKIEVTWTAYDACGNSSSIIQNIIIKRPKKIHIPADTLLDCGAITIPDSTGWPRIDIDGDGKGDQIITDQKSYCNFDLVYEDQRVKGTCGKNYNILRIFTLIEDCEEEKVPIYIDTQYLVIKDTIAPVIACPDNYMLGSSTNPYIFKTSYNDCSGLPSDLTLPTGTDNCSTTLEPVVLGIYRLSDNQLISNKLETLNPLEVGKYRIAYAIQDECGNTSDACNIYFDIKDQTIPTAICGDELIISLSHGDISISAKEISRGSFDECGLDTILVRRTICGSIDQYPDAINYYVAGRFGTNLEANGWSSHIDIGCCDLNTTVKVQVLVFDKSGNHNKCWLTIRPDNQPQSVCGDLPDAIDYCDNFKTNYIGDPTDANGNKAFDDDEWQPINELLLDAINSQFGSPACNASNTTCIKNSIEQEYQLIKDFCGVQTMRRRFRTRSYDETIYPWYYQTITISYRPGWSITFPADTILQCGTTDVGNIPEMTLGINRGTCDQIGWEVKDEIFETQDGSCFKVLRHWYVINGCQHSDVANPFQLPRDQIGGKVTANADRTFTSSDVIAGVSLDSKGYFTYTQIIVVMDNEVPIITIADVDTCIVGVSDAPPYTHSDVTPGYAPYECDTLRLFSATGMDCTASEQLDFRYEIFEGDVRLSSGEGSSFYYVVQANNSYRVRFIASDNCGNSGAAERTFTFYDCKRPTALCQDISLNLNASEMVTIHAKDINLYSYDNCTDTSELDFRIWHSSLGIPAPSNVIEVLSLPTSITLNCNYIGNSTVNLYITDNALLYDFCTADITISDNLNICNNLRPSISGRIQTTEGDMVEQVEIQVSGTGTMPKMVTTDFSGSFNYEVEMGADYMIAPKKNMNPLNGVSTFDLVLIQKHILGLRPFESPYHYIAADVNQSATVTAYDMVILRQLILNIITEFPNNESWKFVNNAFPMNSKNPLESGYQQTHTVANISKNIVVDFMAVKVGDVNGNARPNRLITAEDRTFNGTFNLFVKNQTVKAGETYLLDFRANNLEEIEGYQFTLQYEGLTFENWEDGFMNETNFGFHLASKGLLTSSWNKAGENESPENDLAFRLKFTATQSGLLSELLDLNSTVTTAESYATDGTLKAVNLVFEAPSALPEGLVLEQNRPNPFNQQTAIDFYLPEASEATLTLMDIAGKIVKQLKGNYAKGQHRILIERADIPASGLIYYQLTSSAGKITKTMLVLGE